MTIATPLLWCDSPLKFEVVSIKPHPTTGVNGVDVVIRRNAPALPNEPARKFTERLATVETLIVEAYGLKAHQVLGLPGWAKPMLAIPGDYYDIDAIAPMEKPTQLELQQMVQSLLADRFHLRIHRETRELPIYAITIAKGGPKVSPVAEDAISRGPTMFYVAQSLSKYLDRPVVDRTGLVGRYKLDVHEISRDGPPTVASISAFLEERFGLKLESRREMTEVLVVDQVERPSAN